MNCLVVAALLVLANCQNIITDSRGNVVQGAGNAWDGAKNKIKGAENQVIGDSNSVQGSSNIIRGSNNVVGDLSSADMAALQKQMADRLAGRFGNIFSRFSEPPKPKAAKIPQAPQSARPSVPAQLPSQVPTSAPAQVLSPAQTSALTQSSTPAPIQASTSAPVLSQPQAQQKANVLQIPQKKEVKRDKRVVNEKKPQKKTMNHVNKEAKAAQKVVQKSSQKLLFRSYGKLPGKKLEDWKSTHDVTGHLRTDLLQRVGLTGGRGDFFFSSIYGIVRVTEGKESFGA